MKIKISRTLITLLGLFVVSTSFAATQASEVQVQNPTAYINSTTGNVEVVMGLDNPTNNKVLLVAATSPMAEQVQLHHFVNKNGKKVMQQTKDIVVAKDKDTELQKNGLHVMLIQLKHSVNANNVVPVTLIFQDGSHTLALAKVVANKNS